MSPYVKAPKIRELGYELKVRDAMDRNLITVQPETPMSKVRGVLRSNRISGIPVIDKNKLVGVV